MGYGEIIDELVSQNVKVTAFYQRMLERGLSGSYSAVLRRVRQVQPKKGKGEEALTQVEREPGAEI